MCTKPIPGSRSRCTRPWLHPRQWPLNFTTRLLQCQRCCRGASRTSRRRGARWARTGGPTAWKPTATCSTRSCAITTSRGCRSAAPRPRRSSRAKRCNPSRFERDDEAAPRAAGLPAVPARNAPHDRQAETAIKRLENLLALRFRHARPLVANADLRTTHAHPYRRLAMAPGILQKVADHAAQQPRLALYRDGFAFQRCLFVARAFFRGERQQIDRFGLLHAFRSVEPARQQDFVDQRVELGDVLLELALAARLGAFLHQLGRHADARERRAQLVRSIRQQRLLRAHQLPDSHRRPVEALCKPRHLVVAFDLHPHVELPRAQGLHALLQPLEPRGEAPDHRIGADTDRDHEQREDEEQRSEEHTSELQSPCNLVCRLLLEKKKKKTDILAHDQMQR